MVNDVLSVASYLSGDDLSEELLIDFWVKDTDPLGDGSSEESFTNCFYKSRAIKESIKLLIDYSIFSEENGKLKFHKLSQKVMQIIYGRSNLFEEYHQKLVKWILPKLKFDIDKQDYEEINKVSKFISHGFSLLEFENEKLDEEYLAELLSRIGEHQQQTGNYIKAKECFKKVFYITEKHFGKDHS